MRSSVRSSTVAPIRAGVSKDRSGNVSQEREQERKTNAVNFSVGDSVTVTGSGYTGIARFVGPVHFAAGTWIGIELKMATGKNDGCVQGKRFFTCLPNCGLFIKAAGCSRKQTTLSRGIITTPTPKSPTKQKPQRDTVDSVNTVLSNEMRKNTMPEKSVKPMSSGTGSSSHIGDVISNALSTTNKDVVSKSSTLGNISTSACSTARMVATARRAAPNSNSVESKPIIVTRANSNMLPPPPPSTAQSIANMQKNFESLRTQMVEMGTKFDVFERFMTNVDTSVKRMEKSVANIEQHTNTNGSIKLVNLIADDTIADTINNTDFPSTSDSKEKDKELLIQEQKEEIALLKDSLRDINALVDQVKREI